MLKISPEDQKSAKMPPKKSKKPITGDDDIQVKYWVFFSVPKKTFKCKIFKISFSQGDDGGDRKHAQLDQGADHDKVEIANT